MLGFGIGGLYMYMHPHDLMQGYGIAHQVGSWLSNVRKSQQQSAFNKVHLVALIIVSKFVECYIDGQPLIGTQL